jgi:hypothetical protein
MKFPRIGGLIQKGAVGISSSEGTPLAARKLLAFIEKAAKD